MSNPDLSRILEQARAMAVAEERNRIAREFHDTLAHSLTGIILNIESLKSAEALLSQMGGDLLADTEALARGALEETRRSILELNPTPLQHKSLGDALMVELAGFAQRASLATQFYIHGTERSLKPDQAITLFRVAQEAFHNIHKYAAARDVMLGLAFEESVVILTVEDDGVGFDPGPTNVAGAGATAQMHGGGFGIQSMATRVRNLGGQLLLTSRPGHGTLVRATIPYTLSGTPAAAYTLADSASEPSPETFLGPTVDTSSDARPIRVLLVDDYPVVRRGIRQILEEQPDIHIVGEAGDGLSAIEQAALLDPDVVLLDLQLPRLSGVEVLVRLQEVHPTANVVILTIFSQDEELFAALKAGARGYILKDASATVIVEAVRDAFHGRASLSHELETQIIDHLAGLEQRAADPDALTEREVEVLGYMRQGLPYKEIGAQLNITAKTVNYHVTHILHKLHVRSRGEAVARALERGVAV